MRTLRVLILSSLVVFPACGPEIRPTVEHPRGAVDLAPPGPRLHPTFEETWWQPATTPVGVFVDSYVTAVYGPVARYTNAAPRDLRPMWDDVQNARCWIYKTPPGEYRCLPGWVQRDKPPFTSDGFYASGGRPSCSNPDDWRYPIPTDNAQRYLVLFDPGKNDGVRVFEAVPTDETITFGFYDPPQPYPTCTPAPSHFHFYKRGPEIPLDVFVRVD